MRGETQAFIVRIWHEALDDKGVPAVWRGSVQQVGSDRQFYFQELEGILRFIEEQTGVEARRSTSKWRSWLARIRHEIA
jgi:hypothetical protein